MRIPCTHAHERTSIPPPGKNYSEIARSAKRAGKSPCTVRDHSRKSNVAPLNITTVFSKGTHLCDEQIDTNTRTIL